MLLALEGMHDLRATILLAHCNCLPAASRQPVIRRFNPLDATASLSIAIAFAESNF